MSTPEHPVITAAVEGDLDEALLGRILVHTGLSLGKVYGRSGKHRLLQAVNGYNHAARFSPWVVLIDLNGDGDCAPEALGQWLPKPSKFMCFRIAVRAAEAWILADRERFARFLGLPVAQVPTNPDELKTPKEELINLSRRSHRKRLREELVPRAGSGRRVGPLYSTRMTEFIQDERNGWRPGAALLASDSLARCVTSLRRLSKKVAE